MSTCDESNYMERYDQMADLVLEGLSIINWSRCQMFPGIANFTKLGKENKHVCTNLAFYHYDWKTAYFLDALQLLCSFTFRFYLINHIIPDVHSYYILQLFVMFFWWWFGNVLIFVIHFAYKSLATYFVKTIRFGHQLSARAKRFCTILCTYVWDDTRFLAGMFRFKLGVKIRGNNRFCCNSLRSRFELNFNGTLQPLFWTVRWYSLLDCTSPGVSSIERNVINCNSNMFHTILIFIKPQPHCLTILPFHDHLLVNNKVY